MLKLHIKNHPILLTIFTAIIVIIIAITLCGYLIIRSFSSNPEINIDIHKYQNYIGQNAEKKYKTKWDMDESIFPESITDNMNVQDYKMVYDNPWDAQYLSYLVVKYDETAYKSEVHRLKSYNSSEYSGIYGAEGFDPEYKLLAMNADPYYGFIYALTDEKDTIIYVEIIFCNYFMDLDYKKYINEQYLPIGFNAGMDNPYEKMQRANTCK